MSRYSSTTRALPPATPEPVVLAQSHARTTAVQCQTEDPRASCPKMRRLRRLPHRGPQANGGCTRAESLLLACSPADVAGLQRRRVPPWPSGLGHKRLGNRGRGVIGRRGEREEDKRHARTHTEGHQSGGTGAFFLQGRSWALPVLEKQDRVSQMQGQTTESSQ